MTDWDRIIEGIQRAMMGVEHAYRAGETLKASPNAESLDAFTVELKRLQEKLEEITWVLEHPGQYSMDEVNDALNRILGGQPAGYRRSRSLNSPVDKEAPSRK